jgi:DNA recombination protein RmuC
MQYGVVIAISVVSLVVLAGVLAAVIGFIAWRKKQDVVDAELSQQMSQQLSQQLSQKLFEQMSELERAMGEQLSRSRDNVDKLREEIQKTVSYKIDTSHSQMQKQFTDQFKQTTEIIENVTEKLVKLESSNNQVVDISKSLKTLQNVMMNPKQRGVVGEFFLNNILDNILPPTSWQKQYTIAAGKQVDAAVFLDDKILPIDAKFSLENYNRYIECPPDTDQKKAYATAVHADIKGRIEETAKYVDEKHGTMSFAFMFIPSEALYYDLVILEVGQGESARNLIEYAYQDKRVIIAGPTTLVAYLQTVLQGMRALQIERNAEEIKKQVRKLETHITKYEECIKRLGKNLNTAVNSFNDASKNFELLDKDIVRITGNDPQVERFIVDHPVLD